MNAAREVQEHFSNDEMAQPRCARGSDRSVGGRGAGMAEPADSFHRAVPGRWLDRRGRAGHRRTPVANARPADRSREQVGGQWCRRHRSCGEERAGWLHHPDRHRPSEHLAASLQPEFRSHEGFGAGRPTFTPARGASGASFSWPRDASRADRPCKATPGHELCDIGCRLAATHRRAVVRPDRRPQTRPCAVSRRRGRRSTTSSRAT